MTISELNTSFLRPSRRFTRNLASYDGGPSITTYMHRHTLIPFSSPPLKLKGKAGNGGSPFADSLGGLLGKEGKEKRKGSWWGHR